MRERALDPVVELVAQRLERSTFAPLGSIREEVLGIVKEIDVHLLDPQPPKRPPELVDEKLWVDAVPAPSVYFTISGKAEPRCSRVRAVASVCPCT